MKRNKYKSRDGRWIDDYVVDDGGEVKVPLHMCDAYRADLVRSFGAADALDLHKPGYRVASRFARDTVSSARRGMISRAAGAWRDAAPQPALVGPGPRAFVEQVGRTGGGLENTGPGPGSTLPAPSAGPAPERPDPNNDQAKRDAAWKAYKDQLGNAWRGMGPAAAGPSPEWTGAGT
jgi:hypothetical protein